jgi:hypothetical protein
MADGPTRKKTLEARVRDLEEVQARHSERLDWLARQRERLMSLFAWVHDQLGEEMPLDDDTDPYNAPRALKEGRG